jgi:hypothetical protein
LTFAFLFAVPDVRAKAAVEDKECKKAVSGKIKPKVKTQKKKKTTKK